MKMRAAIFNRVSKFCENVNEQIVVSGISASFPNANNVQEFAEKMFTGNYTFDGKTKKFCEIDVDLLKPTNIEDPVYGAILEKIYEAIFDSGYNPAFLNGKECAVCAVVNLSVSESFARNVTYVAKKGVYDFLNITGPSRVLAHANILEGCDTACNFIKTGRCKCALVILCENNGTVGVLFLQKAEHARRVYAEIIHISNSRTAGSKDTSIFQPAESIKKVCDEVNVKIDDVSWLEINGLEAEEQCHVLEEVLRNKQTPSVVTTTVPNASFSESGHVETIFKVLVTEHTGTLPSLPQQNFAGNKTNSEFESVDKTKVWNGGIVSINNFGSDGINFHMILKLYSRKLLNGAVLHIPNIVAVSGRTEESVQRLLSEIENNRDDTGYVQLLREIFTEDVPFHEYRGFILQSNDSQPKTYVDKVTSRFSPSYYVFPNFDTAVARISPNLKNLDVFHTTLLKCHEALKYKNFDLLSIIGEVSDVYTSNILYQCVVSTAIQLALVDVLKNLSVSLDGFIGFGSGEIVCAYADSAINLEQAILIAYYWGVFISDQKKVRVAEKEIQELGVSYENVKDKLPKGIACEYVTPYSSLIYGVKNIVKLFVQENQNMFPFESFSQKQYVPLGHTVFEFSEILNQVLVTETSKSEKWISSSSKPVSPEYFVDALFGAHSSSVLGSTISDDATVVCIGLQNFSTIIKEMSVKGIGNNFASAKFISLLEQDTENNLNTLLYNFGRMFVSGIDMDFRKLYPTPQYPVSPDTKMISSLISWKHTQAPATICGGGSMSIEREVAISMKDEKMRYILGHGIDTVVFFPGCGYLVLVWETLALMYNTVYTELSVVFENVRFRRAVVVKPNESTVLRIAIHSSGSFEITKNNELISSGYVYAPKNIKKHVCPSIENNNLEGGDVNDMNSEDLYTCFKLRGYNYKDVFRCIINSNFEGTRLRLKWVQNWVTFLDGLLQSVILRDMKEGLYIPLGIDKVVVDVAKHKIITEHFSEGIPAYGDKSLNILQSGGVQIMGPPIFRPIVRKIDSRCPLLLRYEYIPLMRTQDTPLHKVASAFGQTLIENFQSKFVNILKLGDEQSIKSDIFLSALRDVIQNVPLFRIPHLEYISEKEITETGNGGSDKKFLQLKQKFQLISATQILSNAKLVRSILRFCAPDGFLATKEKLSTDISPALGLIVCCDYVCGEDRIMLLRKPTSISDDSLIVKVSSDDYSWIQELQNLVKKSNKSRIYLVSENEPFSGLLGFFNCLRMERCYESVRCIFILDKKAPKFSLDDNFYINQLSHDFAVNIYKNGHWGKYIRHPIDALNAVSTFHSYIGAPKIGNTKRLIWLQGPLSKDEAKRSEKLVHVFYASLTQTDVLLATGRLAAEALIKSQLEKEFAFGMEFSGIMNTGEKVFGICESGALSTVVTPNDDFTFKVPDKWNLEDAATLALNYITVIYSLIISSCLKSKNSVLVHNAATTMGQAAILIAKYYDCEIFITVSDEKEAKLLSDNFPFLKEDYIGSATDMSFEQMVLKKTQGRGVNIVLNSLPEDAIPASINSLSTNGHFVQLKPIDFNKVNTLSSTVFAKNIHFHSATAEDLFKLPKEVKSEIKEIFTNLVAENAVRPLVKKIFSSEHVQQAFEFAVSTKNVAKTLIKVRTEENVETDELCNFVKSATPKFYCLPNKVYVICGGLGGMGLELAHRLVLRGARKMVLTSRHGVRTGFQKWRLNMWKSFGVTVSVCSKDISKLENTRDLLNEANALGPVAGIFNLAAVLKDKTFKNQTEEMFKTSAGAKSIGTLNLDKCSRVQCPELQHFVVFSSISCGYGNVGQTNYGMSNSAVERICEQRKQDGYPALAVQWGGVADVGMAAAIVRDNDIPIAGTYLQPIKSCLDCLEEFLCCNDTIVTSLVVAPK